jgi:ATP-dependent Lon protease
MPGRIISGVKSAGSKNPVLLLDEIDKLGTDYRGDPASALLEVLDGEQNKTFRDNYLEVPFDLSKVLFITTANTTSTIPAALLDRMEVIELSSYTDEEKVMIAKHHLLPKALDKVGLKKGQVQVYDNAWREIIDGYTRESGVRNLQREIGALCRKAALKFATDESTRRVTVTAPRVEEYLGVRKYLKDVMPSENQVGLVTGLAWTAVGGVTLEVEVNVVEGTGKLEMTGSLGDVMKESVHAAMSYIRSRAGCYHIPADFYRTKDIHVHFPEGAVPKDGPSAGITICTALVSALTGAPVRRDIAMTGEISIRGRVMAIGGLKEKTMAALRHGVKTVIIPADNEKDLEEIDQTVRSKLTFIPVTHVDTVISTALDLGQLETPKVVPVAEAKPAEVTLRQ